MSMYDALGQFLNETGLVEVNLSFNQINEIVKLPDSAMGLDSTWWGNSKNPSRVHSVSWMKAGWKADKKNYYNGFIRFYKYR
jgi:hypothetical protein